MKKSVRRGSMLAIAATAIMMSSCTKNFDFSVPENNVTDEYAKGWENAFGEIDSNQDWNLATQKTVNITVDGTKTVQILTGNPYLNEGKLAGEFIVDNQLSAKVDLSKDTEVIYAVQRNENGKKDVKTTYISEDGTFNVDFTADATAARAATRSGSRTATELKVTRNNFLELVMYYASEEWNIWDFNSIVNDYMTNSGTRHKIAFNSWGDKYFDASAGSVSSSHVYVDKTLKDAVNSIIPENQKSSYYNTIIQDVDLVVTEEGPVTLTLLSATTSNNAAIGYYIYTDKTVNNEAVTAPSDYPTKEFLSNGGYNSELGNYYTYVASTRVVTDQQKLADKMVIIPNVKSSDISPTTIYSGEQVGGSNCKQIKLLYKNPTTGEYSENFPAGTKISFFVVPNANASSTSIDASRTVFSFADMNVDAHKSRLDYYYYSNFSNDTYSSSHAATFKVQDKIVIGFEDAGYYSGNDFDYNDCVFLLDGNFEEDIIPDPIPEEDPEENSWIIACEDLGDTDDYDFNDVVFKVSHVSGQTTATVTPLAAGGTLETFIIHNNSYLGETHQLLGAKQSASGSYPMINTSKITATATPLEVTVAEDFTITKNMGGFGILVKGKNGDSNATLITAPTAGTAPQMFCVPATWAWPTERTKIQDAYPDFAKWSADSNNIEWYNNSVADKVVGGGAQ